MNSLKDKIVVVTGASRGIGRGIAIGLGEAGATVYVTGRTVAGGKTDETLPGTIHEAAEAVTQAGGMGVALVCDHRDDSQVEAAFARVVSESGRIDVLVNNVRVKA